MDASPVDVAVIGGGPAGLNAALLLARSRRSVVVVDAGEPRNAAAGHTHNFLTRDGTPPGELLWLGRAEVESYGAVIIPDRVELVERSEHGRLRLALSDGQSIMARRVLVATGLTDRLPNDIGGLAERWGRDVLHCPYCHGWEVRDRAIAVIATSAHSVRQALLFRQVSDDVTMITHEQPPPDGVDASELAASGIDVVPGRVASLVIIDDQVLGVQLDNGVVVPADAVAVAPEFVARADFLAPLGVVPVEHPAGWHVPADPTGQTAVPGVWVAGNVTDLAAGLVGAAASGAAVAGAINFDLVREDVDQRVASALPQAPMSRAG